MSAQPRPTVFLSHSHIDKRVARRLVRRLTAHGIKVWIDECELRIGTTLSSSIRSQIQRADSAKEMVAFEQERRRILATDEQEPNEEADT